MNFRKLSKEKRNHLLIVAVITAAALGSMGYFLIKGGYDEIAQQRQKQQAAEQKLEQMRAAIKRAHELDSQLAEAQAALQEREASMASGDLYSWMHGVLRKFQRSYKVEIPQISAVSTPTPVDMLPDCGYKQVSVGVAGTAYYHDLGKFIADFENQFPLMRIQNLTLDQNPLPVPGERDKLAFRMDVVALIKPGQP